MENLVRDYNQINVEYYIQVFTKIKNIANKANLANLGDQTDHD